MTSHSEGVHVKLEKVENKWHVVTKQFNNVMGTRLDRGRGDYPTCGSWSTDRAFASKMMLIWDKFIELNKKAE